MNRDGFVEDRRSFPWAWAIFVAGLKVLLFLLDPVPKFFFGDSYCYLETATSGWIPPDHSFTYGYFIRATMLLHQSLWPLMVAQCLMSIGCAVGLAYLCKRFMGVRPFWACVTGTMCALEPIQLYWERAVMTETLSLFLLVLYFWACFLYLQRARAGVLVMLQALGIGLVSVRLSFLSLVIGATFLLPLMAQSMDAHVRPRIRAAESPGKWRRRVVHLLLSVGLMWVLHGCYKWTYGRLSGSPSGYCGASGYVLLATWAPVLKASDFPDEGLGRAILESLAFDPRDRRLRNHQLFSPGGLVHKLKEMIPEERGETLARSAALSALRRDPVGVLKLGLLTLKDFLDLGYLRRMVLEDLAAHQEEEYRNFVSVFKERLSLPSQNSQPVTWTKRYYLLGIPWYLALLSTPLWGLWALPRAPVGSRPATALLFFATLCVLGVATILAVQPVVRYLHPMGWLALAVLGVILGRKPRHAHPVVDG